MQSGFTADTELGVGTFDNRNGDGESVICCDGSVVVLQSDITVNTKLGVVTIIEGNGDGAGVTF